MLVLGIQDVETQWDSFFAFSKGEKQTEVIGEVQKEIRPVCYISEQFNDFYTEIRDKIKQQRNKRNYREQCIICLNSILHTNLFFAFQKADTRIWNPSQLTDAITIFYIHHQDGLKRTNPLFNLRVS